MKKLFSTVPALLLTISLFAQGGINFENSAWKDILAKAKLENKMVFLDAYASWCGPCKWMVKNIFPQKEVGDFFNQNFVCAQIDMEKGEGVDLAKKYKVKAYPTFLFMNADGEVQYKALGSREADDFLKTASRALNPEMRLEKLKKRYDKGEHSFDLVRTYLQVLQDADEPTQEVADDFFQKNQDDLVSKEGSQMVMDYLTDPNSPTFDFLLQHRADFENYAGKEAVSDKIYRLYQQSYRNTSTKTDSVYRIDFHAFDDAVDRIKKSGFEKADELEGKAYIFYYDRTGDKDKYAISVVAYLERFGAKDWQEYNSYAWYFYENVSSPEELKKAENWARKSVALDDNYYNEDTLASLLYKNGNYKEAETHATKAIALADADGTDHSSTDELLTKIRQAQK